MSCFLLFFGLPKYANYGLLVVDDMPKATEDNDECEMHISCCMLLPPQRGIDSSKGFLGGT